MTLRHVQPGDPFQPNAQTHNAFVEAARAHQAGQVAGPPTPGSQWMVDVRNDGPGTIQRFDAVELLGPLIDDEQNPAQFDALVGFKVDFPADPDQPGQLAIVQEPIGSGRIGLAMIFGISAVRELSVDSEGHTRARAGSDGELVSAEEGPASILWKSPAGAGPRRAVVAITQATPPSAAASRWGRIIESAADLDNNRWTYTVEWVELGETLDWEVIDDKADPVMAMNTIEAPNGPTGVQGNGEDVDRFPEGWSIVPIGDGAVVRCWGPYTREEQDWWLFSETNQSDGECPK